MRGTSRSPEFCLLLGLVLGSLAMPGVAHSQACQDQDADGFDGIDAACTSGTDCDDTALDLDDDGLADGFTIHPGAPEFCDGVDSDCDGLEDGVDLNVGSLPGAPATATTTPFTQIPDPFGGGPGSVIDSQDVSVGPAVIDDLDVTLHILHVLPEDLEITLTSPSGAIVQLVAAGSTEGTLNNLVDTVLDDEAADPVDSCATPCTGSFQPNESLSSFDGEDPNGTWTIEVTDTVGNFSSTSILNEWTLDFETLVPDDNDQDGFVDCEDYGGDCNDTDPDVHPDAIDCPLDSIDNDCDDTVDEGGDEDDDGYIDDSCPTGDDCNDDNEDINPGVDDDGDGASICDDCDDTDATVHPGAEEVCGDGVDQDCSGADLPADSDGDGFDDTACDGDDCDDTDALVNPGVDSDGDGDHACIDCNDASTIQGPSQTEECSDFVDNDCDGLVDNRDIDLDGYVDSDCTGGDDCDDEDAAVHAGVDADGDGASICEDCDETDPNLSPFASETCDDGVDQDCNGTDLLGDVDGDDHDIAECGGDDCDDTDATVHPGAEEICNGIDSNCDGVSTATDVDVDGYFDANCDGDDCDDGVDTVHPGAEELCNGIDDDCDPATGAGGDFESESDSDSDGQSPCEGDCDDTDPAIHGEALETCDLVDNNCDGVVDEGFVRDSDEDGEPKVDCGGADCDDNDRLTYPDATEDCQDEVDNDCDGDIDIDDGDCEVSSDRQVGCGCAMMTTVDGKPVGALLLLALAVLTARRRRELQVQ